VKCGHATGAPSKVMGARLLAWCAGVLASSARVVARRVLLLALAGGAAFLVYQPAHAQEDAPGFVQDTLVQDTLVVSVTRNEEDPLSLPQAVGVVSRAEIERSAPTLLLDALRGETGVLVQQTTAGQAAPIIRGLVGSHVLLLVDGVPLNNGTFRQGPSQYLSTVDPASVERIEVIRGPSAVLYGSDGIGGVVNVVTRGAPRPGQAPAGFSATTTAASATSRLSQRIETERRLGAVGLRGGLTYLSSGNIDPGGELPVQEPTAFDGRSADFAFFAPVSTGGLDVRLQYSSIDDAPGYDRLVNFRAPELGRNALYTFDLQDRLSARAELRTRHAFLGGTQLKAVVFGLQQREGRKSIDFEEDAEGSPVPGSELESVRDDVLSYGTQLQARALVPGGVLLTAGADARVNRVAASGYVEDRTNGSRTPLVRLGESGPIPAGRFPDGSRFESLAAFALAERQFGRLALSAGARIGRDRVFAPLAVEEGGTVDRSFGSQVFQGGAVLDLGSGFEAVAFVGEGFRAPNIYDFSTLTQVAGGLLLPNPELDPEKSLTYEGGIKWRNGGGSGTWFRGGVTAHRTALSGLLDRVPTTTASGDTLVDGLRAFTTENVHRARVYGLEGEAAVELPSGLYAEVNTWWTRGDEWDAEGNAEPMTRIPPLSSQLHVGWRGKQGRWLEYAVSAAGSQERLSSREKRDSRIDPDGTPGYAVHHVRAGLPVSGIGQIAFGVENVFDRLYRDHGSGIDNPGRSFWGSLKVEF
jgi:hemoglobin/transferrin/lactoferrin receptor protein